MRMEAPDGWRFIHGRGWCRVDAAGNVVGKPEGAGRWRKFPTGRWVFEPARPEEPAATNINVQVAERLPPAQQHFIALKAQLPDKSLKDLAAILAAMFPEERISYSVVRQWDVRHKRRGIITKPTRERGKMSKRTHVKIRVIRADPEEAERLACGKTRAARRALGRLIADSDISPEDPEQA